MKQTRLAVLLDFLPGWLNTIVVSLIYSIFCVIGILFFSSFAGIIHNLYLVLFGTEEYISFYDGRYQRIWSYNIWSYMFEVLGCFFISVVFTILYLMHDCKKFFIGIGLILTFNVALIAAIVDNENFDVTRFLDEDMILVYIFLIVSAIIMFFVMPRSLKKFTHKTATIAEPIIDERKLSETKE